MAKSLVTFAQIDANYITKGDRIALTGWWMAAEESLALKMTASAYAAEAVRQLPNASENTVRQYVSAVRSILLGKVVKLNGESFKMADFGGIADLRLAVGTANGGKGKSERKSGVARIVADAKGMSKAEIRASIAALQALL